MKKKNLIALFGLSVIMYLFISVSASNANEHTLADAIKFYKNGDYSQCFVLLEELAKKDTSNALIYYYLGMTNAQLGRGGEAISNYEKAINLTPRNSNLSRYARKGKRCIETPDKCEESLFESLEDEFIQNKKGKKFSNEVQSEIERLKIENLMREMNRKDTLEPQKFKDFKDFSGVPTDEEIVLALRILQKAGFGNMFNNGISDLSAFTGNSHQDLMFNMMNPNSMNSQLIQTLFTNNITQGF